ncbi:MAG: alpha/beta hydrolase [Polyangiales bacterium]|nr:alpha/beta hydrolase [Myxococcales bacterium]
MKYEDQGFISADDGTRLFYGVLGSGPVVVLSDGIGCDGFVWAYLQPALAEHYRVVHCHYRGHGRSGPPGDGGVGIARLAADVSHVLDHLGIERAASLGHSMGTQVCLELYRRDPARIAGLGLLCGSYGHITHTFHGTNVLEQVLPKLLEMVGTRRGLARAIWGRVPFSVAFQFARAVGEVDSLAIREEDFRNYWNHIGLMEPGVFLETLHSAGDHSAEDLLPSINAPTLVVAAERDTFTPPALAREMSERIPNAEFLVLPGGSHAAPVEQPKRTVGRVLDFLAKRVYPVPSLAQLESPPVRPPDSPSS